MANKQDPSPSVNAAVPNEAKQPQLSPAKPSPTSQKSPPSLIRVPSSLGKTNALPKTSPQESSIKPSQKPLTSSCNQESDFYSKQVFSKQTKVQVKSKLQLPTEDTNSSATQEELPKEDIRQERLGQQVGRVPQSLPSSHNSLSTVNTLSSPEPLYSVSGSSNVNNKPSSAALQVPTYQHSTRSEQIPARVAGIEAGISLPQSRHDESPHYRVPPVQFSQAPPPIVVQSNLMNITQPTPPQQISVDLLNNPSRPPAAVFQHHPMQPLPKTVPHIAPLPPVHPLPTPQIIQPLIHPEPSADPSDWSIEETIISISLLDPTLAVHVESFRVHEIDGKALLLLNSEVMMKYLGLKLGPALKICNIIDKLKGKKHLPIG